MVICIKVEAMQNNNNITNTNKVYVNPNFNRVHSSYPVNPVMHVNPRFSHIITNGLSTSSNVAKIHVNPNFVKVTSVDSQREFYNNCQKPDIYNTNTFSSQRHIDLKKHMGMPISTQPCYSLTRQNASCEQREEKVINLSKPVTQHSRYTLVRPQQVNVPTRGDGQEAQKPKKTFQVNKYKSIPLNYVKRDLDNSKTATVLYVEKNNAISYNKKYGTSTNSRNKDKFKLINHNLENVKNDKIKMKTFNDPHKLRSNQLSLKKIKGNLKKNNIPCPMFRKFGKCLRNLHGKCEYLHDKKHVSICRKFIKGLCHDKDCLLSHDLTTKKMPTCYFYLQGTCTKSDCPYLHVKLNEMVKICPDFQKGYCEKGSKCLLRHTDVQSQKKKKKSSLVRPSISKRKCNKIKCKTENNINIQGIKQSIDNEVNGPESDKTEVNSDYRYYQENKDNIKVSEICENIKPIRCKLGKLPSFIQL